MRLGVLFSGGKDSTYALHIASEMEQVVCLITLQSKNPESFMFHTPNINMTVLQAQALRLPLITKVTEGKKETELADLEAAISEAQHQFQIDGVVTGAVESVYQAQRIQRICNKLDLWCFNPLWKKNQQSLLEELVERGFKVVISGVFAYPLDSSWLGKEIDRQLIIQLVELGEKFGFSPSGEGGEIETAVLDAPLFKHKIEILEYEIESKGNAGVYRIQQARLVPK